MKKYVLVVVLFFAVCGSSFGQRKEPQDTFRWQMDLLFSQLEKDRIPHGILLDYAMEFTNVPAFNGTLTDSTFANLAVLEEVYKTLLMGTINNSASGFVSPDDFDTRLKNNRSVDFIALTGLYFKYSKFRDDALSSNRLIHEFREEDRSSGYDHYYDTKPKFYDSYFRGRWQNPYQEMKTFALTPAIKRYRGLQFKVKIPAEIFYSNAQNEIQNLQIDFGNGRGYINVGFNQEVAVVYASEGVKTWKYKLTLNDRTIMYSQSMIKIEKTFGVIPWSERHNH